jgi:hypothetical protein
MSGDDDDREERARRTLVNLAAAIAVLLVAIGAVWAFKALDEQRRLQRCIDSGRRDCIELGAREIAPPDGS